jgi:Flp pilus assembly protein TadD
LFNLASQWGDKPAETQKEIAMELTRVIQTSGKWIAACLILLTILMVGTTRAEYANKNLTDMNDPVYWLDQGGLFATYGSYTAAIKAFNKALALDASNSKAYFDRGLSYAEMGELNQAMVDINKAISLDSGQSSYYYGRGRVLLLSGQLDQARADFEKAAEMGNLDALHYLQEGR